MKKIFRLTCNEGSLEGGGDRNMIEVDVIASDIVEAKEIFYANQENRVYGRFIKSWRDMGPADAEE